MAIDKSIADYILTRHGDDEEYPHRFITCPCCGLEEQFLDPHRAIKMRWAPVAPSNCLYAVHLCARCQSQWVRVHEEGRLVGFRTV